MKFKQITVSYERRVNLKDYEFCTLRQEYVVELNENDDVEDVEKVLWSSARDSIRREGRDILKSRQPSLPNLNGVKTDTH